MSPSLVHLPVPDEVKLSWSKRLEEPRLPRVSLTKSTNNLLVLRCPSDLLDTSDLTTSVA